MTGDLRAADAIAREIEVQHAGHPASWYARACIIYARVTDLEDTAGREEFFALCDSCIAECERMETRSDHHSAELAYLHGSALSAKALMMQREGTTVRALRYLMGSRQEFQAAIDLDSTFYDAYLGRGAYRYGAATNAKLLSWLPWIPSAESGWNDMWLAVDRSRFSKYSALSALVWFVIQQKKYESADSICQAGLKRFPGSRSFLWPRLSIRMRQHEWAMAEETARELVAQYLANEGNNGYDVTGLYATLMTCADSLQRAEEAVEYARAGLSAYRKPDVALRRQPTLKLMEQRLEQGGAARSARD